MPGLLVSVLEVFEELGLHVLEAKASCADSFRLEAVGGEVILENRNYKIEHFILFINEHMDASLDGTYLWHFILYYLLSYGNSS